MLLYVIGFSLAVFAVVYTMALISVALKTG